LLAAVGLRPSRAAPAELIAAADRHFLKPHLMESLPA